jgi:hypothetical protein
MLGLVAVFGHARVMSTDPNESAPPTCGAGVAQHAAIPAKLGEMFTALADTLELHRRMLVLDDEDALREDNVYRELAAAWRDIARRVHDVASRMAVQRDLPMGAHDESAWGDDHRRAFAAFVKAQSEALALLQDAAPRDERMLATMS